MTGGSTDDAKTAKWPGKAVDAEGADLVAPIKAVLDELGLLKAPKPKEGEKDATAGIIESTTLEVTTQVTGLLKTGGALAGVAAAGGSIWAGLAEEPVLAAVAPRAVGAPVLLQRWHAAGRRDLQHRLERDGGHLGVDRTDRLRC